VARGRCLWTTLCYPRDAAIANEQALAELGPHARAAPELHALALAGIAWGESLMGDPETAGRLVGEIAGLSGRLAPDPALEAELAFVLGMSDLRAGHGERSEREIDRAVALALEAGRPELAQVSLSVAGAVAAARGDFARVLEYADRALGVGHHGRHLEIQALAARAYALSRLERHAEAMETAATASMLAAESANEPRQALAAFDRGSIALAAGCADAACLQLSAALAVADAPLPRATARLRLAEALLRAGDTEGAAHELARVPFEPVVPADIPESLVPRLERLEGLIAAAQGDAEAADRGLGAAERAWRAMLGRAPDGNLFGATILDVGRVPVAGLVEPALELGRVLAERALVLAGNGRADAAARAAAESEGLADRLGFDGYRATLADAAMVHDRATEV
jgi:tetratricopeptide (TPR) repeat protein